MGIPDYDLMFDLLDISSRGYLTINQLQEFQTEVYFSPLDVRQIEAAITTVCGRKAGGTCTKESFGSVVEELGRRVLLEESVEWDFKSLDVTGCGRISLSSTLLLFKCVHGEHFSLQTWDKFLSSRPKSCPDVSFDEVKLSLCDLPTGGPCEDGQFLDAKEKVEFQGSEELYEEWSELEKLQEDNYKIAERVAIRNQESSKLKQKSKQRIRRLERDGIDALLYDDESEAEDDEGRKGRQQIGASDLMAILKSKYETLREKLLVEMIEQEFGEGMWMALSESEQDERLVHTKLKERRLSAKDVSITHSQPSAATREYQRNLFALLGHGRLRAEQIFHEESEKRSNLEDEGRTESEINEIFHKEWRELLAGQVDSDTMLQEICNRYQQEKESMKGMIRGEGDFPMTISQRLQEFKLLYREQLKASLEQSFESACLVIGVAETVTSAHKIDRFHFAKDLQEQLAERHLSERRGHRLQTEFAQHQLDYHMHEGGIVEHYEDVIKALERKHRAEMEMMVNMLQGKDSSQSRSDAKKLTSEERENQFLVLKTRRQGWRNRISEEKIETKSVHLGLLQEAVSIVCVNKRLEMSHSAESDVTIAITLLAKLLQQQEIDARTLLAMKEEQTSDELLRIRQEQEQMYREEWLDNLSAVILGTSDVTQLEDDIVKLLEEKYDSVRQKVVEEALRDQTGAKEWENTPVVERDKLIAKAKTSEKKHRLRKKFDGALKLLGEGFMSSEKFLSHLGENRQAFVEKLNTVLEKRRNRLSEGLEPENANRGIEERSLKSSGNLWKDLDERYKSEKQLLVQWLQEGGNGTREVSDAMIRLQQHKRLTEQEPNMLCALLAMGLHERHRRVDNERLTQDDSRRHLLAGEHFVLARLRESNDGKEMEDAEPNKDVLSEWMDAVLREVERKHRMERHFLTSLLLDNALEDIRSEAREMSEDERQKRLLELKDERDVLDLDEKGDQDMNHTILEMACAFKLESRRFRLKSEKKESRVTDDVVFVSLVADLHQRHNDQCEEIVEVILDKSKDELATTRAKQIQTYKSEYMENVASVLMTYDGLGTNDEILRALENKYDTLRDKLLLDALRKQLGEDEWKRLSERERQLRLMKLKLEAKRLRRDDKLDELAKLLGEGFAADVNLKKLLGENRERYEQQLREKLARRRERLAKGLPPEDSEDEQDTEEESADGKSLLENIERRFEEERDALMAKLLGANNQFLSERERQALLARLKREQLKAKLEEKFGSAALVLGLAERQRKSAEERLMSDRARHEELARQRLAERRNRKNKKKGVCDEDIVTEGDSGVLQEAVLKMLENKHTEEREALVALLENDENNLHDLARSMTAEQREEHIRKLKQRKNDLTKDDAEVHREILQESAIMKFTSRQRNLELQKTEETISKNIVIVSLLADLQQEQDKESEILLALLPDKDKTELINLQTRLLSDAQSDVRSNLMTVFATPEQITSVGEEQLVDALDSKYDTLRDKLLSEAMMKEMGAAEWQALSEQERQARLVKMKVKERRLRNEGKMDELQALLGAAFDAEANLNDLMGQNKARYKERMREKLEKRRQRLKEGMSKDEVAKLEADEDEQFEDEMKQDANVNPLLKLMHCYDKEKETLLAALRNNDARFAGERQRQAELARLRRDERKARQEEKFDTAALVLGLAQAQKANLEEMQKNDRLRQEQLARDRLAARRKKKSEDLQNILREKEQEQLDEISDKENLLALQEAILKEMEKKQECEREFLEKLLQEEEKSELRKKTQGESKEQRTERLIELKNLRQQWRESSADGTEISGKQHEDILREAVCLNVITKIAELKANWSEGEGEVKNEDVQVAILANLQQIQDQEAEILLKDLSSKTASTLTQLRAVQHQAKRLRWYDNIAVSLLGMKTHMRQPDRENVPSEEELLNALDEKYDALKDKLIAESLMSDLGAAEWGKLSEQERQSRILKIRLQERRLRQEGNVDEANRLFGEGLEHAASLSKLMGETKGQQKHALRRRLQKLRELKAAGIEMTTEEAQLLEDEIEDGTIDEEVSTEDVMRDLQERYEEEKKALLASLSGQDKRFSSERQRQLELARLRREQKKIAKEDKFDAAAMVLGLAKQQEAARETSYRKDRARHEQLARERLATLKAKRAEKGAALVLETDDEQREAIEKKLREEQENENNVMSQEVLEIQKGGVVAVQEAVLREVERKHSVEIKMLSELIDVSEADSQAIAAASYLNEKQRDEKMADLYNDYKSWKTATVRASNGSDHAVTKEEKEQEILRKADNQMKLMGILRDGIVLKVLNLKEQLSAKGIDESKLKEELGVLLVADLQEKQTTEGRAVETILVEKDEEMLNRVKDDQRRIRQECIVDNLASVLLQKDQEMVVEDSGDVARMEVENMKQLSEMEEELEEAKRQKLLTGASEADIMAALDEIKRQQEAKKRAMNATLERQRNLAWAKLEAKRRRRDDKQYEEDIAASLLMMAEQESTLVRERTMIQRSKQGESLQERLARRREERAKRKAKEEMEKNGEEEDIEGATSDTSNQATTESGERYVEKTVKLKDRKPSLPDGFSMKREKTVVDVEVSEDKKKEIIVSLLREHTTFGMGFERERKRQEENIVERRMKKKSTVVAAAANIIGLGERQKTMVEQKRKEERDRQFTLVRDRISRVRHERTMTMMEPGKDSKGFAHILSQEEAEGLSDEEKMKLIAAKMEEKFKVEERRASTTVQPPVSLTAYSDLDEEDSEKNDRRSSTRLDEKGKEKKVKERLAARKKARKADRIAISATPEDTGEDSSVPPNNKTSSA